MKYIVVDKNMPEDYIKKLKRFPYKIVKTKENFNLPQGISAHPDILVHSLPNGDIVVDRDNFSYYENIFKDRKVFKTENSLAYDYKNHVSLNGFFYKGYFIGTPKKIRTPDLLVRSQTLYPAELSAQICDREIYYHNLYLNSIFII